jgi:hypothetical protein
LSWGSSGLDESLLFDGRKFLIGDSFSGEIDIYIQEITNPVPLRSDVAIFSIANTNRIG